MFPAILTRPLHAIGSYAASPDPLGRVANLIALCILGNQPTYPLFVAWALGRWDFAVMLTWLTAPLFAMVPWVTKRSVPAGKLLMCGAGLANTAFSVMLEGRSSGVAWFFLPCGLLAVGLLGRAGWVLAAVALGLGLGLNHIATASLPQLWRLNAASVFTLCCFMSLLLWRAHRRA